MQINELPLLLSQISGNAGVRPVQQRRIEERRKDDEGDGEEDSADELDEYQIRPDQQLLIPLALLADCLFGTCGRDGYGHLLDASNLQRAGEAAVAADPPEVHGHEDRR